MSQGLNTDFTLAPVESVDSIWRIIVVELGSVHVRILSCVRFVSMKFALIKSRRP